MLRHVIGKGAPVAAGAAAAAPSTAHCRAQNSSRSSITGTVKGDREQTNSLDSTKTGLDLSGIGSANEDWLLADVHEKGVLFSHEDVQDVVMQVLGHPRTPASHKGGLSISEDDQTDSDASSAADANEHMAAADMQIMRCQQDRVTNFTESLINLVNQPHVQLAVARTLVNDPNFQKLLRDENKVDDTVFYPVAARTGFEVTELEEGETEAEQENPIKQIASKIAGNLVRLGRGLRDAAQDVLVNIGFQIHALLGRPFKQTAAAEGQATESVVGTPDSAWMGRLLMTVGCAVITILLFKRMHVV